MEQAEEVLVRVTTYRDILVIEPVIMLAAGTHPNWTPQGPTNSLNMIMDTRSHLGVSAAALEWMQSIERTDVDLGVINWFDAMERRLFGWKGSSYLSLMSRKVMGSRNFHLFPDDCVPIPNETRRSIRDAIDDTMRGPS